LVDLTCIGTREDSATKFPERLIEILGTCRAFSVTVALTTGESLPLAEAAVATINFEVVVKARVDMLGRSSTAIRRLKSTCPRRNIGELGRLQVDIAAPVLAG
jgi:hypothetical protein